ncbi:endonuclease, partial [Streptomyces drozdowiczii]
VLAELRSRVDPPGVLLERDDAFPPAGELAGELDAIRGTLEKGGGTSAAWAPPEVPPAVPVAESVRDGVAVAQTALLSALVAGTPAPKGFDRQRLRVQSRALAAKRADVVAKVAPELPEILGSGYREAFLAYAGARPMTAGYRRDALDFAEHLLVAGRPEDDAARRRLTYWWRDRAAPRPPGRTTRLVRAARSVLAGR